MLWQGCGGRCEIDRCQRVRFREAGTTELHLRLLNDGLLIWSLNSVLPSYGSARTYTPRLTYCATAETQHRFHFRFRYPCKAVLM